MQKRIKELSTGTFKAIKKALDNEKGELSALAWTLGSAVVVVLIIAVFMALAPSTAENLWNSFITYAKNAFGL